MFATYVIEMMTHEMASYLPSYRREVRRDTDMQKQHTVYATRSNSRKLQKTVNFFSFPYGICPDKNVVRCDCQVP